MIAPIVGGIAAVGAAAACGLGVPIESGEIAGVRWRVRWACWRIKGELLLPAVPGFASRWQSAITIRGMGPQAIDLAKRAIQQLAAAKGAPAATRAPRMVKVLARRVGS